MQPAAEPNFKIDCGRVWACTNRTDGWNLHDGTGNRSWKKHVNFAEPFTSKPEVVTAFSLFDFINDEGIDYRLNVAVENVDLVGFDLVVSTWNDTEVWSAAVSWLAIDTAKAQKEGAMIFTGRVDFHKNDQGYALHHGNGVRSIKKHVDFPHRFINTPTVGTAFCKVDCLNSANVRISASADQVNLNGFDAELQTWGDSEVWAGSIAWIAIDGGLHKSKEGQVLAGAQQFSRVLNPNYLLDRGEGGRSLAEHLIFKRAFRNRPKVISFISKIEVLTQQRPDDTRDFRISCDAANATAQGFELTVSTWKDTPVSLCDVSWIAFGESSGIEWNVNNADVIGPDNPNPVRHPVFPIQANASSSSSNNSGDGDDDDDDDDDDNQGQNAVAPARPAQTDSDSDEPIGHIAKKQKTGPDSFRPTSVSSSASANNAEPAEESDSQRECKICFDAIINTVIVPCGHLCVCEECAKLLKKQAQKQCPICKQKFKDIIKTFAT